jgi:putative ABC transport system substrate-binding protein
MKRRDLLSLIAGSAMAPTAVPATAAHAQSTGRLRVVGICSGSVENDPDGQARNESFRQGLRALGWIEGQNVRYEYRWMANSAERARALAADIVALSPDVILSSGTVPTIALHEATTSTPIVFVNVTDPVAGGLVASLARPGGNITGLTPFEYPISGKWLELLHEAAPQVSRVALMGDPNNHNFRGFGPPFEEAARRLAIQPSQIAALDAADIERGIGTLAASPGGGVIVTAAVFSLVHRELIFRLTTKLGVPAIYWSRFFPETGGLISYGASSDQLHREAAVYVDRVLRGDKPANLPIQTATKYETVVNLRTARALGLTVPAHLLAGADDVID